MYLTSPSQMCAPLSVLDFGAGWTAPHAATLRAEFPSFSIVAYDFGRNFNPQVHCADPYVRCYNLVYASNVLNVQPSLRALKHTIAQLALAVYPMTGMVLANYPGSPRKMRGVFNHQAMASLLWEFFRKVERVGGSHSTPVWRLRHPYVRKAAAIKARHTRQEREIANVRPTGIIVQNALVPRMVKALLTNYVQNDLDPSALHTLDPGAV